MIYVFREILIKQSVFREILIKQSQTGIFLYRDNSFQHNPVKCLLGKNISAQIIDYKQEFTIGERSVLRN